MSASTINPRYLQARRRAARLAAKTDHQGLSVPAYVRRHLEPRVQIGILRDPAAPIRIQPAIHTPDGSGVRRDGLVAAIVMMCFGLVFFGVI